MSSGEEGELSNGGGDGRCMATVFRVGGGGVGLWGGWCVNVAGAGRPEELQGMPVGPVASGKLGRSRCERFLSNGAEPLKLITEGEFGCSVL